LRHLDDVLVGAWVLAAESLRVGVLYQGRDVVRVGGVDHIEEELPVREVGCRALLREELGELGLRHDIGDQVHDAQLVVLRDLHGPQLRPWNEVLAPREDLLEEVLGDLLCGGEVVLACIEF